MPPGKKDEPLTPQELALVKLWIDQGAKPPTMAIVKPKVVLGVPPPVVHPVRAVAVSSDKLPIIASGRGNQIHLYNVVEDKKAVDVKFSKTLIDPGLTTPDKKPVSAAHLSLVESMAFRPMARHWLRAVSRR